MAAIANEAVVSIGLLLFGVGLLTCFCLAMLMVMVAAYLGYMGLFVIFVFTILLAVLWWTIIEAVLSSYKTLMFCFMEVTITCGIVVARG